jgi:hypothetical protein
MQGFLCKTGVELLNYITLNLLPFSIAELTGAGIRFDSFADYAFHGFLPRIHDQAQRPSTAYSNYYQTYVERDVRQIVQRRSGRKAGRWPPLKSSPHPPSH